MAPSAENIPVASAIAKCPSGIKGLDELTGGGGCLENTEVGISW